jgi:hypothetical protein
VPATTFAKAFGDQLVASGWFCRGWSGCASIQCRFFNAKKSLMLGGPLELINLSALPSWLV